MQLDQYKTFVSSTNFSLKSGAFYTKNAHYGLLKKTFYSLDFILRKLDLHDYASAVLCRVSKAALVASVVFPIRGVGFGCLGQILRAG